MKLGLRIDVYTFRGNRYGVPQLCRILANHALRATFFFCGTSIDLCGSLRLIAGMLMALCTTTTIYFSYKKPAMDYLAFAKESLSIADDRKISLFGDHEGFKGLFSMASEIPIKVIGNPKEIRTQGLYVWSDKKDNDAMLRALQRNADVTVLLEKRIDRRIMRLAVIKPF